MAGFNFDKLVQKVNEVADKSVLLAKKAADKTVETAKVAKINADITAEKDKLRKAYMQLGKLYYDTYKDTPEEAFTSAVDEVSKIRAAIKAKRAEIDALKAVDNKVDVCADIFEEEAPEAECEAVEEDGIPETEEAGNEADLFDDITEDSIPETEEAPITEETTQE